MANRHAECLGRGKGSVLALVSVGLQVVTEVKNTLFSHCGSVGSAECKGQREECLEREKRSVLTPTSDSWQQLTEVDKDIESKHWQEEHRRKKQALENEAQQKRGLTSVDVEHKRCDVAAVPLTAEEKASAGEGIAETLTRSKERELAATSGCEGSVEKRSTKSKHYSTTDDSKEGAPAKEGVGSSEGSRVNRGAECTGELLDVSPAVRIAENERDPTLRGQGPQGLTEELSGGDNAVTNSSLVRERPCKDVSSGIGLEKVELSASLATEREDELLGNHQDSAREEAGEGFDDVDECQRRTKGSKGGTKMRAKRRKRLKDKNAAEIAMRFKKGFKRRNEKARKGPLSSLTGLYRMRPRGQKENKSAAHCTRNRLHQEACEREKASERKKCDKGRDAVEKEVQKSARKLQEKCDCHHGQVFYRMRPNYTNRRKKKKREAHDSRKESAGKGTSRCSFRRASDQCPRGGATIVSNGSLRAFRPAAVGLLLCFAVAAGGGGAIYQITGARRVSLRPSQSPRSPANKTNVASRARLPRDGALTWDSCGSGDRGRKQSARDCSVQPATFSLDHGLDVWRPPATSSLSPAA
ncbi:hypothetical protein HPB52_004558 [Rhipicephalus sanguineus]|uniref:Transmembrane protein n=1 Tax=Rhipicephalus sanguineus TaxID=34632 RepID=A0A9D4PU78_RHISA|nr:hypothetical protein HPB52_004558 [Rhipicephalus sanguineus]